MELYSIVAFFQFYMIALAGILRLPPITHGSGMQSPRNWENDFVGSTWKTSSPVQMGARYLDVTEMGMNNYTSSDPRYHNFTARIHLNEIVCWRRRKNARWAENRMALANCAAGYGAYAEGGRGGRTYTITSSEDDATNPKPGTLRYGVAIPGRVWIVFERSMNIVLKMPLLVSSYKTIDGRGAQVHISGGACILLYKVQNVIIHSLNIHHCQATGPGYVVWTDSKIRHLGNTDGDGISVSFSRHVWIDHNTLLSCRDGLVDVTLGSSYVTISNNWFKNHDEVMILGHSDQYSEDKAMRITVAYNYFGPGCVQRMPRVRFGYVHIVNNYYEPWGLYAIGGSAHPTIRSEGNMFLAPDDNSIKQITRQICTDGTCQPQLWRWKSVHDVFLNEAYFVQTGRGKADPKYVGRQKFRAKKGKWVKYLTADAGSLICSVGRHC